MGSPGQWWVEHHRERAKQVGVQKAARNLRKQGCPMEIALGVLAPKKSRQEEEYLRLSSLRAMQMAQNAFPANYGALGLSSCFGGSWWAL